MVKTIFFTASALLGAAGISWQTNTTKIVTLQARVVELEKQQAETAELLYDGVRLRCLKDSNDILVQTMLHCNEVMGRKRGASALPSPADMTRNLQSLSR